MFVDMTDLLAAPTSVPKADALPGCATPRALISALFAGFGQLQTLSWIAVDGGFWPLSPERFPNGILQVFRSCAG